MLDTDDFTSNDRVKYIQEDEQVSHQEVTALKSEIESNRELLKEKDARISDQKVYIEHLVKLLHNDAENGQISDNEEAQ